MRFAAAALCCSLLLSTAVSAETPAVQPTFPVAGQTWQYLDENPPGSWSITAYSLGGHEISEGAKEQAQAAVEDGISHGFQTASELERGIISIVKLGLDPQNYKKTNLLSSLYTYDNLYRDGLDGAYLALMAYQAVGGAVPESARNSIASVVDFIVSSQQRSGGFALTAGRDPDVEVTAMAITALAYKRDIPYVDAAINKAVEWLRMQQNANGTFSKNDLPSCEATAAVLTALRVNGISADDPRFVKNNATLLDALDLFENIDGGYASTMGEDSNTAATERAVIALCTNETGLSPFLPPAQYPGYVEPEIDGVQVYLQFFASFLAMIGVVYLLLLLTIKIGQKWGGTKIPPIPDPYDSGLQKEVSDSHAIEFNIPMKAVLPDFDTIHEHESITNHQEKTTDQ